MRAVYWSEVAVSQIITMTSVGAAEGTHGEVALGSGVPDGAGMDTTPIVDVGGVVGDCWSIKCFRILYTNQTDTA